MQKIICRHGNETIEFSNASSYRLIDAIGLTSSEYTVNTKSASAEIGEIYLGTTAKKRNIYITIDIRENYQERRDYLLSFFQPESTGTLICQDGVIQRQIMYYTESINIDFSGIVRTASISLICPSPLFSAMESVIVPMSYWEPLLKYPFVFSGPFKLANRVGQRIATVNNPQNCRIGLEITFLANGIVVNPSFTNIDLQKTFHLTVTMFSGDSITVKTGAGEKAIYSSDPEAGEIWNMGDPWLQIEPGINTFQFDAESGAENLDVTFCYTPKYLGV